MTSEIWRHLRTVAMVVMLAMGSMALQGCDEGPMEEAGEELDEAGDEIEDSLD